MIRRTQLAWLTTIIGTSLLLVGGWLFVPILTTTAQDTEVLAPSGDNSYCLVCHTDNTQDVFFLGDGTPRSINVNHNILANSVHGEDNPQGALGCIDCHEGMLFPHQPVIAPNERVYSINKANICLNCHTEQIETLVDGVHYTALADGNLRAATCVDCHGAHDIQPPDEPRAEIAITCGNCHQIVFNEYVESVHGQGLGAGDPNVPTCIDCHGVHGIQHPTTALFRNRSPQLCADCHADAELMDQYGISTDVFNSYLTDFHGMTVALFQQKSPDTASNKAVCFDCHGVHNILSADEEGSTIIQENLLATCQDCHPDATTDFPDSWIGHFPTTFESHPFLFLVNLFYDILIPVVLGGFVLLVAIDIFGRIRKWIARLLTSS